MKETIKRILREQVNVYDNVVVNVGLDGIEQGTKGTVVHKYDDTTYEVEFFDEGGNTIGVELVNSDDFTLD